MKRSTMLILAAIVLLVLLPLVMPLPKGLEEPFTGSDGQAEGVITQLAPHYQPWFQPFWEPPSGEIESLLFALQAALGAGVICYYFGLKHGERRQRRREGSAPADV
jgi:cobalt transport protein